METKNCSKCLNELEISNFSFCNKSKNQLNSRCKKCISIKGKKEYLKRITIKDYIYTEFKKCAKCQETKNRSLFDISLNSKSNLSSYCKPCKSEWFKIRKNKNLESYTFQRIKNSARKRKLELLDKQQFLDWFKITEDRCFYCDCTPSEYIKNRDNILITNSLKKYKEIFCNPLHMKITQLTIDRKDPSQGYTLNNITKACWICNYLKCGIWTSTDMALLLVKTRAIIEHRLTDLKEGY